MAQRYLAVLLLTSCLVTGGLCFEFKKADCSKVLLTYTIWVGTDISETHELNVSVPKGSNFYQVMEKAATMDPQYQFGATDHPQFGHFIHTLAGHSQGENLFWMIYVLDQAPNVQSPPQVEDLSDFGVDSLIVENGKHYLFWLRHVEPHTNDIPKE